MEALKARLRGLQEYKDGILNESALLRAQREELLTSRHELDLKIQSLSDQIHAIERPRLYDCMMEMSHVAKQLGGPRVGGKRG